MSGAEANKTAYVHEVEIANFLVNNGHKFEQHKRILGYGDKEWIVDFYLPDDGIIIEAKTLTYLQQKKNAIIIGANGIAGVYKDLYKLCELQECYNLIPILYLKLPNNRLLPKTFIANLSGHGIFYITLPEQILTVIQKKGIREVNRISNLVESQKLELDVQQNLKHNIQLKISKQNLQIVKAYANGASMWHIGRELGLAAIQTQREIKKYLKATLSMPMLKEEEQTKLLEVQP